MSEKDICLRFGTSTHARKLSVREMSVGSFSNDDGDGNENVKKAIGLLRKTTSSHVHHAFLYISLPLLHNYDVEMPRVRSIGKSGFRFSKSKSGFPTRTRNPKTDFTSEKSVLRVYFN